MRSCRIETRRLSSQHERVKRENWIRMWLWSAYARHAATCKKGRPMNERLLYVLWTFICALWMNGSDSSSHGKKRRCCSSFACSSAVAAASTSSLSQQVEPARMFSTRTAQSHGFRFRVLWCCVCVSECFACLCVVTITSWSSYYYYLCEDYQFDETKIIFFSLHVRSGKEMRPFPSNNAIQNWTVFVQLRHCDWRRRPPRQMDLMYYLVMLFLWPNHFTHTNVPHIYFVWIKLGTQQSGLSTGGAGDSTACVVPVSISVNNETIWYTQR